MQNLRVLCNVSLEKILTQSYFNWTLEKKNTDHFLIKL